MDNMTEIRYLNGDATCPVGEGKKIIAHCCNDIGAWGAGFVVAISRKWKEPECQYRQWYRSQKGFKLGRVQFVKVEDNIIVANMIGQHKIHSQGKVPPIRYGAIRKCLTIVAKASLANNASVHAPKFGAGLAGGSWGEIERIIQEELCEKSISVTVYNYGG